MLTVQPLLASTKPANACGVRECGTPGVTRTRYIPLRRRALYPGEVRRRIAAPKALDVLYPSHMPFVNGDVVKKLMKRLAIGRLWAYNIKVSEFIPERKGSYLCRTKN